jgi:predicted DNA-binding transcriptional regulator YafY
MLLQSRPNQKASALAEQLGVSVRSVHRYLAMLDEIGIPIYSERGPYGGFSLVRGYRMPPLVFAPEEAVAVSLGASLVEDLFGPLYRDAARGALAKLDNLLPEEQRREVAWARQTLAATGMHRADLESLTSRLQILRRALRERSRVTMLYRGGSQPHPQPRQVDPYALVHRWGWWYVVGHCHLRQAIRSFRVDRILELTLTEQSYLPPADFDIHQYLATEMQAQPLLTAYLRFPPEVAHVAVENRIYWETINTQPDGSVIATLLTPNLEWAASTALAYGPIVEVLAPPELRQMVYLWAQEIANAYT